MNKKITTIDDLAVMIGKESQAAEKRFGILEDKMRKIIVDIKEIRTDIKDIHKDIKEIRTDINSVDTRSAVIGLDVRVSKLEGTG